jgi:hypothetical protein
MYIVISTTSLNIEVVATNDAARCFNIASKLHIDIEKLTSTLPKCLS